jgi:hypothetical protein
MKNNENAIICKTFIDQNEFQQAVLDYIYSVDFNKMIDSTIFKDSPECKQAIAHGMVIASMLTSRCTLYCLGKDEEKMQIINNITVNLTPEDIKEIIAEKIRKDIPGISVKPEDIELCVGKKIVEYFHDESEELYFKKAVVNCRIDEED